MFFENSLIFSNLTGFIVLQERRYQSSEFTHYLTSAIGDKMADVAKELEMSLSDDLLEQFYDNGGDDIELAQCLRAVRMRALAKK